MQRKILKRIIIIIFICLFILTIKIYAVNDSVNYSSDIIIGENTISSEVSNNGSIDNEIIDNSLLDEEEHNEDINSTGSSNVENKITTSSTYTPKSAVQPTSTYSTVATIPEANLTFNNILNAILIGIGIALILFAIAILIRLK